ncbi:hypothetical protein [Azoarcus indigens]|uniref:hypothetical protein n=1 Tax=Azoarcus indigens TaxID=29545 RepID=UPI001B7D23F4|nr:hypothetical protein [Azoarcus indigens]
MRLDRSLVRTDFRDFITPALVAMRQRAITGPKGELSVHKYLVYSAYGWLALSGTLHFVIDVLSQFLRGKRPPGMETALYYGLNSAYALGQVAFGLLGLFLAWRAMNVVSQTPVLVLTVAAALGWLAITFLFMEYREPKFNISIFLALTLAAFFTR